MKARKPKSNCTKTGPTQQRHHCNSLIEEHKIRLSEIQNAVHSYLQKGRTILTSEANGYISVVADIQATKESTQDIQQVADKLLRQMKMIIKENAAKGNSNPEKVPTDNFSNISSTTELKRLHNTLSNIDVAVNREDLSNKHFKIPSNQFDSKDFAQSRETTIVQKRNKPVTGKKVNNKPYRKRANSERFSKNKKLYSSYKTVDSAKAISKKLDLMNDARQDEITINKININYTKDNSISLPTTNFKNSSITDTIIQIISSNDETPNILDPSTNKGLNNEFDDYSNAKVVKIKQNFTNEYTNENMILGSNDETPDYLTAKTMNKKLDLSNRACKEEITTKQNSINYTKVNSMNVPATNLKNSNITETIIQAIGSNDETPDIHANKINTNKTNKGLNNEFHHSNIKVSNIKMNFTNGYAKESVAKTLSTDNTKNKRSATPQFDSTVDPSQTLSLYGRASSILNGFQESYHSTETNETIMQNENMKTNAAKKHNETMNTHINNVIRDLGANSINITNTGMYLKHVEANQVPFKSAGFTNKSQTVNTSILSNTVDPYRPTDTYIPIQHQNMKTQKYNNEDLELHISSFTVVNNQVDDNLSLQNQKYLRQCDTSCTSSTLKNIKVLSQKTLHITQLPESLNTIPDSQNIDTCKNTCVFKPKINGKVKNDKAVKRTPKKPRRKRNAVLTKNPQNREVLVSNCTVTDSSTQSIKLNFSKKKILEDLRCTRKTPKNPRHKRNNVSTKKSQNRELLVNNCTVTDSSTQSIQLNVGKKIILEDLTWVENIKFVRSIEANEYFSIELNESFWKENVTFPGLKDEDFYI